MLDGGEATEPGLRRAAFSGEPVPASLERYVAKVREASFRVTDADVDDLRSAGWSEDAIFEVTVAAALGAAERALQAGLQALDEAGRS